MKDRTGKTPPLYGTPQEEQELLEEARELEIKVMQFHSKVADRAIRCQQEALRHWPHQKTEKLFDLNLVGLSSNSRSHLQYGFMALRNFISPQQPEEDS